MNKCVYLLGSGHEGVLGLVAAAESERGSGAAAAADYYGLLH
jgi:hypothetical protein